MIKNLNLLSPSFIITEIYKYKDYIIKKADITEKEFNLLISLIFENIKIINKSEYEGFLKILKNKIKDSKDIPYLAVAFAEKADGIWTHDPHFRKQDKINIYTNIDLLKFD